MESVNSAVELEPVSEKRMTSSRYRINSPKSKGKEGVNAISTVMQSTQ